VVPVELEEWQAEELVPVLEMESEPGLEPG
jgi:hypothetical protein